MVLTTLYRSLGIEVFRDHVYLSGEDLEAAGQGLFRVPRTGGEHEVLVIGQGRPHYFKVSDSGIYWDDELGLMQLPLDGGTPALLWPNETDTAQSVALDAGSVYFSTAGTEGGRLMRADLDGSQVAVILDHSVGLLSVAVNDTTALAAEHLSFGGSQVLSVPKCGCP